MEKRNISPLKGEYSFHGIANKKKGKKEKRAFLGLFWGFPYPTLPYGVKSLTRAISGFSRLWRKGKGITWPGNSYGNGQGIVQRMDLEWPFPIPSNEGCAHTHKRRTKGKHIVNKRKQRSNKRKQKGLT